jgi:hypothetical protein
LDAKDETFLGQRTAQPNRAESLRGPQQVQSQLEFAALDNVEQLEGDGQPEPPTVPAEEAIHQPPSPDQPEAGENPGTNPTITAFKNTARALQ